MRNQDGGLGTNWSYIAVSVVVFAVLTIMVLYMPNLRQIDGNVLHSIRLALSPYPAYIPRFCSEFGYASHLLWPQIAAGSVLVSHRKYTKAFLLIFFTQATFFLTNIIKEYVCRERPCIYPGFSFPSRHSSLTMCFYGILIYLVLHYVKSDFWRNFLAILFGVWIFMVGISRLWLGVHFPVDVIAGMILGFIMVNLFIIISRALSR